MAPTVTEAITAALKFCARAAAQESEGLSTPKALSRFTKLGYFGEAILTSRWNQGKCSTDRISTEKAQGGPLCR